MSRVSRKGSMFIRSTRSAFGFTKPMSGQATIASREVVRELMQEAAERRGGPQVRAAFSPDRMGTGGRRLAAGGLGGVSRRRAARQEDAHSRAAAQGFMVHLRAGPRRVESAQADDVRELFSSLAAAISKTKKPVFDFAVVDEAQDITIAHVRFFAALGGSRRNALFFAGDLGQRIFQQPFSWKALGVDIRGRSRTLRVNYRTSHQIRTQADRLLGPSVTDVDGNAEDRSDTVSVFNGPPPMVRSFKSESEEIAFVGDWIAERAKAGVVPHEFGVFVRSPAQLDRACAAVKAAGFAFKILDEHVETASGHVSISTMHLAKGLEFRAVAVMACDDEVIPLAGAHRNGRRRCGFAGSVRHRAASAVRRMHPRSGSSAGHRRRPGFRVPGRFHEGGSRRPACLSGTHCYAWRRWARPLIRPASPAIPRCARDRPFSREREKGSLLRRQRGQRRGAGLELEFGEAGVEAVRGEERGVGSLFDD